MAEGRHIKNRFWLYLNDVLSNQRQISYEEAESCWDTGHVTKFRKFKMADGRHFENGFIAIYQPEIIRFQWH